MYMYCTNTKNFSSLIRGELLYSVNFWRRKTLAITGGSPNFNNVSYKESKQTGIHQSFPPPNTCAIWYCTVLYM